MSRQGRVDARAGRGREQRVRAPLTRQVRREPRHAIAPGSLRRGVLARSLGGGEVPEHVLRTRVNSHAVEGERPGVGNVDDRDRIRRLSRKFQKLGVQRRLRENRVRHGVADGRDEHDVGVVPRDFASLGKFRELVFNASFENLLERRIHARVASNHAVLRIHERPEQHQTVRPRVLAVLEHVPKGLVAQIARAGERSGRDDDGLGPEHRRGRRGLGARRRRGGDDALGHEAVS